MTPIRCFVLEPTDTARRALRRYHPSSDTANKCPLPWGYHDAQVSFDEVAVVLGDGGRYSIPTDGEPPHEAWAGWPTHCDCGYEFQNSDEWQLFSERLYRRSDTGELTTLRDAPAGALWRATWFEGRADHCGPDGQAWVCKTPGGDWHIDGRASNCTMPNDNVHRCWVRHGTAPDFHVDKNGNTCAAGAGSIMAGSYHGFLHHGHLTSC